MTTILGLDPSLTSTGVAFLDNNGIAVTHLASKGRAGATLNESAKRVDQLCDDLHHLLADLDHITLVVIEAPAMAHANAGTSLINGLWWSYVRTVHTAGVPIVSVAPTSLKVYGCGKGNAGKDEVLLAVARRYPQAPIETNDQADAVVLAAMGWHHVTGTPLVDLPATHTRALAKVQWPADVPAGSSRAGVSA